MRVHQATRARIQSFDPVNSIDNFFDYENFMRPGHGLLDSSLLQMNSQQMGSISPDVLTWRDPNQQLVTVTCRLNPLFDINRFLQGEPQYEREGQATPQATPTSGPGCRVEVRSYPAAPSYSTLLSDHTFIHFTAATGQEFEFRGGPEYQPNLAHPPSRCSNCVGTTYGAVTASWAPFDSEHATDYGVPGTRSVLVSEDCDKFTCLENEYYRINRTCTPYKSLGPNSNTVASTMLHKCNIPHRKPLSLWTFGWNNIPDL